MLLKSLRRRALPGLGALALVALIPLGVAEAAPHHPKPQPKLTSGYDGYPAAKTVLRSSLTGSSVTDPALFGVLPGTSPWVLKRGTVRLTADGGFTLRVRGLVIPVAPANGTNPVPTLSASVFCNGTLVKTTPTVPFSTRGDAVIDTDIGDLPSPCVAPAVFVHPNATVSRYIAFNGSR